MKIIGIIAEYNPFHNGHLYHLTESMKQANADACVVVMSGDFVQRGAPAIFSKRSRAKAAIFGGASLVLELPVYYACSSAEFFANGAISILNGLGCIDELWFGSEYFDLERLQLFADVFLTEPIVYRNALKNALKTGVSFPKARQLAIEEYFKSEGLLISSDEFDALSSPNNLLAIEYLKALKRTNSKIVPKNILRTDQGYHNLSTEHSFSSASSIRHALRNQVPLEHLRHTLPSYSVSMENEKITPIFLDDFSLLLQYKLFTSDQNTLQEYLDIHPDLANKMLKYASDFQGLTSYLESLKSKDLTFTRLSRALMHILLEIKTKEALKLKSLDYPSYARILGFDQEKKAVLTKIHASATIPMISKLSKCQNFDAGRRTLLETDLLASNLYQAAISQKYQLPFKTELQQSIIIKKEE